MRWIVSLLLLVLTAGPGTAQIVPVWRIVTDVTASICPAMRDGDVDAAVRAAQSFGYRVDDGARPTAGIAGSGHYVVMDGRHFDRLTLAASDGIAWCAISLQQATPRSVADAADPHLARLGYRRLPGRNDRIAWAGEDREAAAFPTLTSRRFTTLALRFNIVGGRPPNP